MSARESLERLIQGRMGLVGDANVLRDLIAEHERMTAPPTDDEREALRQVIADSFFSMEAGQAWDAEGPYSYERPVPTGGDDALAVDIIASPVWRNRHRGPVTDAEVEASGRVMYEKDAAIHRWATPWAKLASSTRSRYYHVARAALEAARGVQS